MTLPQQHSLCVPAARILSLHVCCSTGEVDDMGADMSFLAHDAMQSPVSRHGPQAHLPGRADLVNQSFDDPGALSRLNPVVPPRLPGTKLTELRCPPVVAVPNAEPACVCCEGERERHLLYTCCSCVQPWRLRECLMVLNCHNVQPILTQTLLRSEIR